MKCGYICSFATMTFDAYLVEKKIDSARFKTQENDRWEEWSSLFNEIGSVSFTAQKLYLINPIRRKYPLPPAPAPTQPAPPPKPAFKPKIS